VRSRSVRRVKKAEFWQVKRRCLGTKAGASTEDHGCTCNGNIITLRTLGQLVADVACENDLGARINLCLSLCHKLVHGSNLNAQSLSALCVEGIANELVAQS